MTITDIRIAMVSNGNDIYFIVDGQKAGIASTVNNSEFTFQSWHGQAVSEYTSFDDAVSDKFFGGKSLIDLLDVADIYFC